MSSRVLFVNYGPGVIVLEVYQKRTGLSACFAADVLVSETPITPGTEGAAYVGRGQYVKVVEVE